MTTLKFTVRVVPLAWSRVRVANGNFGKPRMFNTPELTAYEELIASSAAIAARSQGWLLVDDKPVTLRLHFRLPIAPSWNKKQRAAMLDQPHCKRPDASNLAKAVEDGIVKCGCVIRDDSQIATLIASKTWSENPGVDVEIQEARGD